MDERIMAPQSHAWRWYLWLRDMLPLVRQSLFGWNEQGGIMAFWKDLLSRTIVNPSPAMRDVIAGERMTPDGRYYDPTERLTVADKNWIAVVRHNADIARDDAGEDDFADWPE